MKEIIFIKDHFAGIKKGKIKKVNEYIYEKFISEGYAEEYKPKKTRKKKTEVKNVD